MATVDDPFGAFEGGDVPDNRRHAPATLRNRDAIQALLTDLSHGRRGYLLELASGTGEHAAHIAGHLPHLTWQPSDIDPDHLASIQAWRAHSGVRTIAEPITLDLLEAGWAARAAAAMAGRAEIIFSANLIHITPPAVADNLIAQAQRALAPGGLLLLYGPFKRDGRHISDSNADFEQWLKSKDPRFGVYCADDLAGRAATCGLSLQEIRPMPANNFTLIFRADFQG